MRYRWYSDWVVVVCVFYVLGPWSVYCLFWHRWGAAGFALLVGSLLAAAVIVIARVARQLR